MSTAEAARLAAWRASDAGKAAWAAVDAAEAAALDAYDAAEVFLAKVAYYTARAAYLAKTTTPVTP